MTRNLPILVPFLLLAACGQAQSPSAGTASDSASAAPDGADAASSAAIGASATPTASAATSSAAAETAVKVESMPLKDGFYVNGVPCSQGSMVTLVAGGSTGVSGLNDMCEPPKIEKTGPTSYRVTGTCSSGGEAQGSEEQSWTSTQIYEISSPTAFTMHDEKGGDATAYRYCAKSSLPEPWRSNPG